MEPVRFYPGSSWRQPGGGRAEERGGHLRPGAASGARGRSRRLCRQTDDTYGQGTTDTLLLVAALAAGAVVPCGAPPASSRPEAPGDATVRLAIRELGQEVDPVEVVAFAEARILYGRVPGAGTPTPGMNAFRLRQGPLAARIYVNRDSPVYRAAARTPTPLPLLRLAATLLHEQVHRTDGEAAAYRLQADFVRSRVRAIPRRRRAEAQRYLRGLEQRAQALQVAETRARPWPVAPASSP